VGGATTHGRACDDGMCPCSNSCQTSHTGKVLVPPPKLSTGGYIADGATLLAAGMWCR
jgi:hypothetical protein